ncbi:hypothetical protein PV08_05349 [Exophiala spinifera]|uniref:Mediator of RNA polymerase II transcription subunit 31 n=1 Tax=Exophiala spinifera TaxID=91928 RepID=A0A0D2BVJ1_9EURO|nr:uncharacterized protein PV08_05349 [Exophiala spinifera]KIW15304.1 hypothetical protein PV08_05349 [Exophiala spinifera]
MEPTTPPRPLSHRFTLELEFVLCLSNPLYLQYLAVNYPHLLNKPVASHNNGDLENSDAARFARYLEYLLGYWRKPEYAKYLTHPGATLRNLALLQQEQFRKDIIRPDVIAKLFETDIGQPTVQSENENPAS